MVIRNDLEWPMLSYYVIYYEKFINVMQWSEMEGLNTRLRYHFENMTGGGGFLIFAGEIWAPMSMIGIKD